MKYLTLLLISTTCMAGHVLESDLGKESGYVVYTNKEDCPGKCLKIKEGDVVEEMKSAMVEEDDKSKPLYEAKSEVESCSDRKDCIAKTANKCDKDHFVVVARDYDEVYCTRIVGYEKISIQKAIVDEDKKAVIAAARKEKRDAEKAMKDRLKQLKDKDDLTAEELKEAVKALLKERG